MTATLDLRGATVVRGHRAILDAVDWTVHPDQRWVVLGRNGSGKTTLLRLASCYLHPTTGTVEVLGARLGRVDVRELRARIGLTSAALADQLRPTLVALDVVMTAKHAALEPWWHRCDDADRARAGTLLERLGVGTFAHREFGTLSSGERQRVLLARTLMIDPGIVLLDEPNAGLDLTGREELVAALATLAADPTSPPIVLVTHHVDEIPPGFTHLLLLRAGRVLTAGPLHDTLTEATLSETFGLALSLERRDGRFSAYAR
ncbi:MAG TPA: ATP-binding cassette domain-containing protein [Acidimicrobiales bacterium]|nr:ATP-binding cassette domain-containing protein [Acidimicrobiales bacterium]